MYECKCASCGHFFRHENKREVTCEICRHKPNPLRAESGTVDDIIISQQIADIKTQQLLDASKPLLDAACLAKHLKEHNISGVSFPAIYLCIREARKGMAPVAEVERLKKELDHHRREHGADLIRTVGEVLKAERERCANIVLGMVPRAFHDMILTPPEAP